VKRRFPQPLVIVLIVVGFLLVGLGGYFVVLGPQKSKAADLDKQIADTNSAIAAARALTLEAKKGAQISVGHTTG
jgi:flagellar basal body-associated protein FliL